jgi:hypothetical protein
VVVIVRVGAPGAFPFAGVGRLGSTYMSVRWPTANVPVGTVEGTVVVVVFGDLDDVVGRERVADPSHAARIAMMAVVVTVTMARLGRPHRVRALIGTETRQRERHRHAPNRPRHPATQSDVASMTTLEHLPGKRVQGEFAHPVASKETSPSST